MEIYLFIFLATALLLPVDTLNVTRGARLAMLSLPFLLLLFMSGTRNETGNDWGPYADYYLSINALDDNAEVFEIGYRLFAYFSKSIGLGYHGFVFLSSLIYLGLFFLAFQRQRGALALVLLFYCTYLLGWMGTARQVIALGLTACAGECLLANRRISFLALVAVAATFHQTAVIFLLAYFLREAPLKSTRWYVILIVVCIAGGQLLKLGLPSIIDQLAGVPGLGEKVIFYGNVGTEELNLASGELLGVLWYAKRLVFLLLFLALRDKLGTPRLAFYFNAYIVSVAIFLLFDPTLPILAIRGSNYFSIYEILLLASLVTARGRWAALAIPLVIVLSAQRLYVSLYAYYPDLYVPYKGLFINEDFLRNSD